jgi:hypothetical protein
LTEKKCSFDVREQNACLTASLLDRCCVEAQGVGEFVVDKVAEGLTELKAGCRHSALEVGVDSAPEVMDHGAGLLALTNLQMCCA